MCKLSGKTGRFRINRNKREIDFHIATGLETLIEKIGQRKTGWNPNFRSEPCRAYLTKGSGMDLITL